MILSAVRLQAHITAPPVPPAPPPSQLRTVGFEAPCPASNQPTEWRSCNNGSRAEPVGDCCGGWADR